MKKMTRYQMYMMKQKLIAVTLMILCLMVTAFSLEFGGLILIFVGPFALWLFNSRYMWIEDKYYDEMREERNYAWRFRD